MGSQRGGDHLAELVDIRLQELDSFREVRDEAESSPLRLCGDGLQGQGVGQPRGLLLL